MSEKWNEIRKTGILVFLLSLPVMIWRSGKIGRVVTIFSTTMILLWTVGKTSDTVITQIVNKWEIRHEANRLLIELGKTKKDIAVVSAFVNSSDSFLRKGVEEKVDVYFGEFREKFFKMEELVKQLESGLDFVSERERAELKERIVELKERILVNGKNINSKTERMKYEKIIKSISLLTSDERDRFLNDLKESGFYVEKQEKRVNMMRSGMMAVSCDTFSVISSFASMDSTRVKEIYFSRLKSKNKESFQEF